VNKTSEMHTALKYKNGGIIRGIEGEEENACKTKGTDLTRLLQRADAWGVGVVC
jgi:hypothetical protein